MARRIAKDCFDFKNNYLVYFYSDWSIESHHFISKLLSQQLMIQVIFLEFGSLTKVESN